jgi:hypothetical protein
LVKGGVKEFLLGDSLEVPVFLNKLCHLNFARKGVDSVLPVVFHGNYIQQTLGILLCQTAYNALWQLQST